MSMNRRSFLKCSSIAATSGIGLMITPHSQAAEMMIAMQLDWKFNVQFAGLLMADHLGLYQKRGLNVTIKSWTDDMVVPEEVAENPMMMGCAEQNLILDAQAKGLPLKAVATMMQASPYALMAMPDRGITQLSDLKGKKVGVHVDGLKVMELVKGVSGLLPDDIEVIEIDYNNKADRLVSGEFDAIQCYAVDEPIPFAKKIGQPPTLLALDEYGYKAYAQVFFATDELLKQQPKMVRRFLKASFEGWKRAISDIPAAARIVAEKYAESGSKYTDVAYQQQSLELVSQYILKGITIAQIGKIAPEQWQQTTDLMAQYKIIEANPDVRSSLSLGFWAGNTM
jgi:NitT/TauT family transport system substrate-binding protein